MVEGSRPLELLKLHRHQLVRQEDLDLLEDFRVYPRLNFELRFSHFGSILLLSSFRLYLSLLRLLVSSSHSSSFAIEYL